MSKLLAAHQRYIARLKIQGAPITAYSCPSCKEMIQTLAAPGQHWDTLSSCPHCSEIHMKYTSGHDAYAAAVPTDGGVRNG